MLVIRDLVGYMDGPVRVIIGPVKRVFGKENVDRKTSKYILPSVHNKILILLIVKF